MAKMAFLVRSGKDCADFLRWNFAPNPAITSAIAMRRLCFLFTCALLLTACKPAIQGTWRAAHPRGDELGLGMDLVREGNKYTGAMYLLEPSAPNDFAHARKFPMTITSVEGNEIHYSVEFLPHEPDQLVLTLSKPVEGPSFRGVMATVNGRGEPVEFNFERVIEK